MAARRKTRRDVLGPGTVGCEKCAGSALEDTGAWILDGMCPDCRAKHITHQRRGGR